MLNIRKTITLLSIVAVTPLFDSPAFASAELEEVANFALMDQDNKFHELDYYCRNPETKGILLFVQGNGCPLVRKRLPDLKRLRDTYGSQGILFAMINANPQDSREDLLEEAEEFGIDFPILKDELQLVAGMLKLERTGEAILIDSKTKELVFRGPIDDRMTYQKERPVASANYVRDAIDALLAHRRIETPVVDSPGCRINMPDKSIAISYSKDVAPILLNRCVPCHTKGGVGPFSMSSYRKVNGWSDMIEEVVLTKQMPPWHADPHIGVFAKSAALRGDEAKTLINWIRSGSPRGEGEDPLVGFTPKLSEWQIGAPDEIIELPTQEIPAEGILEYRYVHLVSPFDHDVWIKAAEVNPGNNRVVHHVIVTSIAPTEERKNNLDGKWITGFAPGTDPFVCPENTGIFLPKGHVLKFEIHYTVSGKEETDRTRLGLYLADETPEREFKTGVVVHSKFEIPPYAREHAEVYRQDIDKDITIYGINPHMHFRGKRMSFEAKFPDGTSRMLLSVPNYNFNWQRSYHFAEPVKLPKGSQLVIRNAWDNSEENPHNPDPSKTVHWGEQSFDEMFFATFAYLEDI